MGRWEGSSELFSRLRIAAAIYLTAFGFPMIGLEAAAPEIPRELARVNGEAITLDELLHHLGALHGDLREPERRVEMPDPMALLDRLINVRLVVQEAEAIGLHELEAVEKQIAAGRREIVRQTVLAERVRDIDAGDSAEIERLYRDAVREVQVESVLFATLEAAEEFRWALANGAEFADAAAAMVEAGSAKSHEAPQYLDASRLRPQLASTVVGLEIGEASPPLEIAEGITVVRLLDVRYPESSEARARAEEESLTRRQQAELTKYGDELRARYASIDRELVESLDYDAATPGLEALRADRRVLVEIRGGEDITVADLTARMETRFFHGVEHAMERQWLTREVPGILDRLILERAVALEAERLGLEERPSFGYALRSQADSIVFGTFVAKVINPKVELDEAELGTFYAEHRSEYTTPEMMRLDSLAFERREDAEVALRRLRQGSDMKWLSTHAEGRTDAESDTIGWRFQGQLFAVEGLEDEVKNALAGAAAGDFRLAEEPDGVTHVLRVMEVFPPEVRPFEQVKKEIAGKVFARKRQEILEEWLGKLRDASEVEVLVDEQALEALLGVEVEAKA